MKYRQTRQKLTRLQALVGALSRPLSINPNESEDNNGDDNDDDAQLGNIRLDEDNENGSNRFFLEGTNSVCSVADENPAASDGNIVIQEKVLPPREEFTPFEGESQDVSVDGFLDEDGNLNEKEETSAAG